MDKVGDHGRFVWYELMTTDVASAKAFYGSVVGWKSQDASTPDLSYTLLSAGKTPVGGLIDLPAQATKKGARPRWAGYVAVDDVDAIARGFRRLGGAVYVPPTDTNIGRISVVADPQTATLALVSGLKPIRSRTSGLREVGHVGWHELLAEDWKKAFAFYGELLGWRKTKGDTEPSDEYQLFAASGQMMGGMFTKRPMEPIPFWLYYFNVGDLDAAMERVKAGGGQVFEGPYILPDDSWFARCRDPQGAAFAIQGTRGPDAIKRAPAADLNWSTEWGGVSSRGKLQVPKRGK